MKELIDGFRTAFNPFQWVIILGLVLYVCTAIENNYKRHVKEELQKRGM